MKNEKKDSLLEAFNQNLISINKQSKILGGKRLYGPTREVPGGGGTSDYIADTYETSGAHGNSAKYGDYIGVDDMAAGGARYQWP